MVFLQQDPEPVGEPGGENAFGHGHDGVLLLLAAHGRPDVRPGAAPAEGAPRGRVPDQDKMLPCSPDANGRALACQPKSAGWVVAQIEPRAPYNDWLMDRVVAYLQTRDWRLFPFTANFDAHKQAAFVRDLREGLGTVNDSGSARKTSATGFIAKLV